MECVKPTDLGTTQALENRDGAAVWLGSSFRCETTEGRGKKFMAHSGNLRVSRSLDEDGVAWIKS